MDYRDSCKDFNYKKCNFQLDLYRERVPQDHQPSAMLLIRGLHRHCWLTASASIPPSITLPEDVGSSHHPIFHVHILLSF